MLLEGSCHCGAVRFEVDADCPVPYQRCYCSICRKVGGGGGYAVNLGARAGSLVVRDESAITHYHAGIAKADVTVASSPAHRAFCAHCASALWVYDPRWPELIHPFASAVDTELPPPPEVVCIMLRYAAPWCEVPPRGQPGTRHFDEYPDESLQEWHRRHGLLAS